MRTLAQVVMLACALPAQAEEPVTLKSLLGQWTEAGNDATVVLKVNPCDCFQTEVPWLGPAEIRIHHDYRGNLRFSDEEKTVCYYKAAFRENGKRLVGVLRLKTADAAGSASSATCPRRF